MDATEAAQLVEEIQHLRTSHMVFVGVLALLSLIAFCYWLRDKSQRRKHELKQKEIDNAAKNARAEKYANSLDRLAQAVSKLDDDTAEQGLQMRTAVEDATLRQERAFDSLNLTLREIRDRQAGVINREDSARIIEDCFDNYITHELQYFVETSLVKNDYGRRKSFVRSKLIDAFDKLMYRAKKNLEYYALSLQISGFFETVEIDGAMSYVLSQSIWTICEDLHEKSLDEYASGSHDAIRLGTPSTDAHRFEDTHASRALRRKIEEARLRVNQCIHEHVNRRMEAAQDIYGDSGEHHTRSHPRPPQDG